MFCQFVIFISYVSRLLRKKYFTFHFIPYLISYTCYISLLAEKIIEILYLILLLFSFFISISFRLVIYWYAIIKCNILKCTFFMLQPRAPPKRYDILTTCDGFSKNNNRDNIPRITDATKANVHTWSEFASWQHLANDAPYWWIFVTGHKRCTNVVRILPIYLI